MDSRKYAAPKTIAAMPILHAEQCRGTLMEVRRKRCCARSNVAFGELLLGLTYGHWRALQTKAIAIILCIKKFVSILVRALA